MKRALLSVLACIGLGASGSALAFSIEGLVYCDSNLNGVFDAGDVPLAGVTVVATADGRAPVTATTGADGQYDLQSGMAAGEWTVSIDAGLNPGASVLSPMGGSYTITLDPYPTEGGVYFVSGADFAIDDPVCRAAVCGDGILDDGEQCDDGNLIDGDGCSAQCTTEFCGDGILSPGEQCDDGNLLNGDGCSATCEFEAGGEGCTPGYWRQEHHADSYPEGYSPDDLFSAYFADAFPGQTLGDVVTAKGGGLNALGRHAVAALLNAASDDVDYDRSVDSVIASFNDAYATGNYEYVKNVFEGFNEQSCPLN